MVSEDRDPGGGIRQRDFDDGFQSSRSKQGAVNDRRVVGGTHDDDALTPLGRIKASVGPSGTVMTIAISLQSSSTGTGSRISDEAARR
jgi:hypothetical protein